MPLRELRRARALTQRDLAEMLQVNQPAVSKIGAASRRVRVQPPFLHRGCRAES